jgi:hypothetical protein
MCATQDERIAALLVRLSHYRFSAMKHSSLPLARRSDETIFRQALVRNRDCELPLGIWDGVKCRSYPTAGSTTREDRKLVSVVGERESTRVTVRSQGMLSALSPCACFLEFHNVLRFSPKRHSVNPVSAR